MPNEKVRVLIADDDLLMQEVLCRYLEKSGYDVVLAGSGVEAWALLEKEGATFDVVLLARMMPKMNGMEVLSKIKESDYLRQIRVIMYTSTSTTQQMKEGIEAGVFYYLVKPFPQEVFLAIVESAVRDSLEYQEAQEALTSQCLSLEILETGTFLLQTLEEVSALASALSKACPTADYVMMGLGDLLLNAVEHGNLNITYDEKTQLLQNGQWEKEIARRLSDPENLNKYVKVIFQRLPGEVHITIKNQGPGFDWRKYIEMNTESMSNHGRGIAMAKALGFDHLEYRGTGNEVFCVVHTSPKDN